MIQIYADADFYVNDFLLGRSPVVPIEQFNGWALEASQAIDQYTFNRLLGADTIPQEVKMCCCSLAQYLYADAQANREGAKQSESIGSYSVSYAEQKRTQSELGVAVRAVIFKWLAHSGLLYRGVG